MLFSSLPDGSPLPALGLGTWRMGEVARTRAAEVAALRRALEIGYRLIDTAEMYGDGGAETVVGSAVAEALRAGDVRRDDLFIISKVLPQHASRAGTHAACDRSRQRLQLERIDLYLLHWRGSVPLHETVQGLQDLVARGDIGHWGVSNFDTADLIELEALDRGCACNQVYFSLGERGPAFELLPWQRQRRMPLMAYSPIDKGAVANEPLLADIGAAYGCSATRVALAWVLAQAGVTAIAKAVRDEHLRDNWAAQSLQLSDEHRRRIDERYPPPQHKTPLAII